jgi:hypothetical protein
MCRDQLALPSDELDAAMVLSAASMLGEEAWPRFRVRRHLDTCVVVACAETASSHLPVDRVIWHDRPNCRCTFVHDVGIPQIEYYAEPIDVSRVGGDAAVAEVEPEEVDIGGRQLGNPVLGPAADLARRGAQPAGRR